MSEFASKSEEKRVTTMYKEKLQELQSACADLQRRLNEALKIPDGMVLVRGKYQYYYKKSECQAKTAEDTDCICWHDEGEGPFPEETHNGPPFLFLRWRLQLDKD